MEENLKKLQQEIERQKQELVDYMYRRTFQEILMNYSEYVNCKIDQKNKLKLLADLENHFVDLEEYEKCKIIVDVKNKILAKQKVDV